MRSGEEARLRGLKVIWTSGGRAQRGHQNQLQGRVIRGGTAQPRVPRGRTELGLEADEGRRSRKARVQTPTSVLTSRRCAPGGGASHRPPEPQAPAQGRAQAGKLGLCRAPLCLHAGPLGLQALSPALGCAESQTQVRGLSPGGLQLESQAAGMVQLLLPGAARLLQRAQQVSLPGPELAFLLLQLPLGPLELEWGQGPGVGVSKATPQPTPSLPGPAWSPRAQK